MKSVAEGRLFESMLCCGVGGTSCRRVSMGSRAMALWVCRRRAACLLVDCTIGIVRVAVWRNVP